MKSRLQFIFLFLGIVLVISCNEDPIVINEGFLKIIGKVYTIKENLKTYLDSARVKIGTDSIVTDSTGSFQFSNLKPSVYELTISRPGYITLQDTIYLAKNDHSEEYSINPIEIEPINFDEYFPSAVGNKWIYSSYEFSNWSYKGYYSSFVVEIINDSIVDNKKFIQVKSYHTYYYPPQESFFYYVIDYEQKRIYRQTSGETKLLADFSLNIGDRIDLSGSNLFFKSDSNRSVFASLRNVKEFLNTDAFTQETSIFAHSIGIFTSDWSGNFGERNRLLKGCIIDNVIIGDTSTFIDSQTLQFYPLSIGNTWVYENHYQFIINADTITKDTYSRFTVISEEAGKFNIKCTEYGSINSETKYFIEYVNPYGLVFRDDVLLDNLAPDVGSNIYDTKRVSLEGYPLEFITFESEVMKEVLNKLTAVRKYGYDFYRYYANYELASDFGLISLEINDVFYKQITKLIEANIGGKFYSLD